MTRIMALSIDDISRFLLLAILLGPFCSPVRGLAKGYHRVGNVTSLFDANCSSTKGIGEGTLTMAHRHSSCSPLGGSPWRNISALLLQDRVRMQTIQQRRSGFSPATPIWAQGILPAWQQLGVGEYLVTIGIGTPRVDQVVNFDTGSHLTWIQCLPCTSPCNRQPNPIFDPTRSSTYIPVPCTDSICRSLINTLPCPSNTSTCTFNMTYMDESFTYGEVALDTLTLTPTQTVPNFAFGCSHISTPAFEGIAGLLGLCNSADSAAGQLYRYYGGVFSYCLPPTYNSVGHLTFGGYSSGTTIRYTPMIRNLGYFYYVEMTGISVAGKMLPIDPSVFATPAAIIDSGTTFTTLPPSAYNSLRMAFRVSMPSKYQLVAPVEGLDPCYNVTGLDTISYPRVTLHFGGGLAVELDFNGIFVAAAGPRLCLAFAPNTDPNQPSMIGNIQQRTLEVVYDLVNAQIGFGTGSCTA